jgi:hypothetical protein
MILRGTRYDFVEAYAKRLELVNGVSEFKRASFDGKVMSTILTGEVLVMDKGAITLNSAVTAGRVEAMGRIDFVIENYYVGPLN